MQFVIPILQILIAFQCFIFLLYLLVDSRLSQVPNRVLAALLVTLGTHMLLNLVNQHLIVGLFPNISIGFGFFYGPLIFLYVLALSTRGFALQRVHAAHFVPGLVSSLLAIVFSIPSYYFAIGIFLSLFIYALKSYRHISYYQNVLGQTRSEDDRIALRWLSSILVFQMIVLIANVTSVALSFSGRPVAGQFAEISLFVFLVALVTAIILKGLAHPNLFAGISEGDRLLAGALMQDTAPGLPEAEAKMLLQRLQNYMGEEKPFLEPSLSIAALSRKLAASPRDVSPIIPLTNVFKSCTISLH